MTVFEHRGCLLINLQPAHLPGFLESLMQIHYVPFAMDREVLSMKRS
jgi:hypothetical protein